MSKIIEFLKDVRLELSRVAWPSRNQTVKYTLAVIISSSLVALFLSGWDAVFSYVLNKFLLK